MKFKPCYDVMESNGKGKAGKFARTATIQAIEWQNPHSYLVLKSFKYIRVSPLSRLEARQKAEQYLASL